VNEKNGVNIFLFIFLFGFILGCASAGFVAYKLYGRRSPGEVDQLSVRHNQLDREYTERQSVIEEQQRSITNSVNECLGYVETAGGIIERTGENTSRAISNLNAAISYIKQGIAEREALKNELNNIRAGLYRIRDDNREFDF